MGVDAVAKLGGGDAMPHGKRHGVDELLGVGAVQGRAEQRIRLLVDEKLHHTVRLVNNLWSGNDRHICNQGLFTTTFSPSVLSPMVDNGGSMNVVVGISRCAVDFLPVPAS